MWEGGNSCVCEEKRGPRLTEGQVWNEVGVPTAGLAGEPILL